MEQVKDRLAAMVPHYDSQGGNITRIYTTGGEIITDRRTARWNLRRLARLYNADLQAIRDNYGKYLGCRQGVPMPFSAGLVLISLKTRLPVGKNDGGYGYINVSAVENIYAAPDCRGRCIIELAGGHKLTCLYACRTVQNKIRLAKIALDYYKQERELSGFSSPLLPVWLKIMEGLIRTVIQETAGPPDSST